jgi:uncharacterized protein
MDLSSGELAAALAAVTVGAAVQGSIGFGMNLVAVPVIALIRPEALPSTLVFLAMPMTVAMALRERHAIDRPGLAWTLVGRLPGTVAGVWIVTALSGDALSTLTGAFVILAVAMSVAWPPIPVNRETALVAGAASGLMGTAAAIGGPPLALVYQRHPGPVLRATLASAFTVGTFVSATALAIGGEVARSDVALAAALLPGLVLGVVLSRVVAHRIDSRWLRPAVLMFAAATGAVAIVRGVW